MCQLESPVRVLDAITLHDRFLELLPKIETHGRIYFRHRKGEEKAETLQEMRALAWKWFQRLMQRGKDPSTFVYNFTKCLVRAVGCGRRVVGMEKPNDVLSPRAQRERGIKVEPLPMSPRASHDTLYATVAGQREHDVFEERLQENAVSPVLDQVAFRIDFPVWLRTWSERDRQIIRDMAQDERTLDLAQKYGCSPGRISQKRDEYRKDWDRFHGEPVEV